MDEDAASVANEIGWRLQRFLEDLEAGKVKPNYPQFVHSLDFMLGEVPECERESLRKRVEWAVANGWRSLGLWTGMDNATEDDLAGVPPGETQVRLVPILGVAP